MRIRPALFSLVLTILVFASTAQATVFFEFRQTNSSQQWARLDSVARGWIAFSEPAFSNGISIDEEMQVQDVVTQVDWRSRGIVGLYFEAQSRFDEFKFSLSDFNNIPLAKGGDYYPIWYVRLTSQGGQAPKGYLTFNTGSRDLSFAFNGDNSSGGFNQDDSGFGCGQSGECTFSGTFRRASLVPVPEPNGLSAVLLGVLLAASACLIRRRLTAG